MKEGRHRYLLQQLRNHLFISARLFKYLRHQGIGRNNLVVLLCEIMTAE